MFSAVASTWSCTVPMAAIESSIALRPALPISSVRWTASPTPRARWAAWSAVCATWSTVATVCGHGGGLLLGAAACCVVLARISALAEASWLTTSRTLKSLLALVLELLALGQVAGHLGEADERAARSCRAVTMTLAQKRSRLAPRASPRPRCAPPRGRAQLHLGLAALHVLRGVEAREVLADDLVGPVTLDPLGPGVPA